MTSPRPQRNDLDAPRFVISVLLADRVGILCDVTSAVTALGGNIDAITQDVVETVFTLTLSATFTTPLTPAAISARIASNVGSAEAVRVCPLPAPATGGADRGGDRYVLIVTGQDRPGILKCTTALLAARDINIEDWNVDRRGSHVTYISVLTVPPGVPIDEVQDALVPPLRAMDMSVCLQHENIFRVTNEIGPVARFVEADSHA